VNAREGDRDRAAAWSLGAVGQIKALKLLDVGTPPGPTTRSHVCGDFFRAEGRMLLEVRFVAGFRPSAGSFKNANPRTAPHSRVRTKKKRPRVGGLSRDMLVRMSSRPPFTPEPQKQDGQILVANRIASEAVVRIVPSNSFDRCNYATSASDRRLHEVFNWCPRSNSRTLTRLGLAGWHFPPHTPAALSSSPRLTAHPAIWVRLLRG
jgi:hypothetical protein